uniref:DUF4238 domain-containing protein n=1 Tax=Panagrellus redivivus TaxID=6233 RepID=A0A7E4VMA4_PANRE
MTQELTSNELETLINDAQKMSNYDAYIKKGDVDQLKSDVMWFIETVLEKQALTHAAVRDNFASAIDKPPEEMLDLEFIDFITGSKCVLGDDFWTTILDGEYVLLRSSVLDIALVLEPKNSITKRKIDEATLRSMIKDELIDEKAKNVIIDVLQNAELGSELSISTAENDLNAHLGPRWTLFVSFEEAVPIYTFAKPSEFIHFGDDAVTILVAYHPVPIVECFDHLTIDDITKFETHGAVAKKHVDKNFRENLVEKLKGISTTNQAVEHVKDLLGDCPCHLIAFAKAVSPPSFDSYATLTIKQYTLLIVF